MRASAGQALARLGKPDAAREEYEQAARILETLAGRIPDEAGRRIFLGDPLVAATLAHAGGSVGLSASTLAEG
jgi:hypothetical protein